MVDIINKKRVGAELSKEELTFAFEGYLKGTVKDYQMSALLMAICFQGLSRREIFDLTDIFLNSGDRLDFSMIPGIKVDKHSTGGVGDKTTLVIAPITAACGVPVIKMSGRGLGHTGGTIDKLESIPGFRTSLTEEEILKQVKEIGIVVTSQTANLVPLDKMVYALRDVTGTVESLGLIAVSIMSKKIAGGADKILLDIKVGKGALLKTREDAEELSYIAKEIGKHYHKEVETIISDMNSPLGKCIGNRLEVIEAIKVLKGEEKGRLTDLCIELATHMVSLGKEIDYSKAKEEVIEAILSGRAYQKFVEFVEYQGGDLKGLVVEEKNFEVHSEEEGLIKSIDALKFGELSVRLGAGRKEVGEQINPQVGIVLSKQVDDTVRIGDLLCTIYYHKEMPKEDIKSYFTME